MGRRDSRSRVLLLSKISYSLFLSRLWSSRIPSTELENISFVGKWIRDLWCGVPRGILTRTRRSFGGLIFLVLRLQHWHLYPQGPGLPAPKTFLWKREKWFWIFVRVFLLVKKRRGKGNLISQLHKGERVKTWTFSLSIFCSLWPSIFMSIVVAVRNMKWDFFPPIDVLPYF